MVASSSLSAGGGAKERCRGGVTGERGRGGGAGERGRRGGGAAERRLGWKRGGSCLLRRWHRASSPSVWSKDEKDRIR
jgi:hypothetical protein